MHPQGPMPDEIQKAERLLTDAHIEAVNALLEAAELKSADIGFCRLSRPDNSAPALRPPHLADRRRRGIGARNRHCRGERIPHRRC